ncbi:uncharacterized protein BO97DRAFT_419867 [Aspergillus homomorphus CBS 101889]|uniref:Uncharacterized protein n=1 Tax=Aspergillus homomorphus (strain CBS 101889) TaxID=1450537 RepID=A0A395IBP5_ASPHC|nr:hypothetical protein BO97DRAFT_419867 [Aspergillus homomorphus CBS 101889]RAL17630.1 hypothetical protein BO97DRAFT_419867 [Aspergillus homomorphus CBS 101889]
MSQDPYETHDGGSDIVGFTTAAAGANSAFSNPMGAVLNAQATYHTHQCIKLRLKGIEGALQDEATGDQRRREWSSPQMRASGQPQRMDLFN